ncbi:glycosyltransferase family 4 protein [Marinifilum sp. D737]|uniref:glycosyltransferase family 4 protein n=1 Tax=Marinifilum sp. D737 TaxID=2969628 RepID=UPI0022742163|nr:glycosyltransferase family 4 protein [Marinifilum sp. D737]MCY1633409.1 glycosyltransferase family 4 protein [Marinifilum sp. D737]
MKEILYIAPGNQNSKGGIGLCVNNYSKHMSNFKVLVTHRFKSKLINSLWFPICIVELLWILIKDRDIKILHIHGASKGSFYRKYILYAFARAFSNKKIIYHIHGGGFRDFYLGSSRFIQRRIRYVINTADMVICLSEKWKHFYTSAFKPKRIRILNNMILPPLNTERKPSNDKFSLLFLGLIGDNKGIFDLIKIIAKNRSQFEDKLELVIAGNGEVDRLTNTISKWKMQEIIHFKGWANEEKKEELFRSSDAFILPSYKEGLPLSILEAMSYGLPIISSKVGGIPDLIHKGKNGILVVPGNQRAIKNAIVKLMTNQALCKNYSQNSTRAVVDFYPDHVLKTLFSIYHELQGNKGLLFEQN